MAVLSDSMLWRRASALGRRPALHLYMRAVSCRIPQSGTRWCMTAPASVKLSRPQYLWAPAPCSLAPCPSPAARPGGPAAGGAGGERGAGGGEGGAAGGAAERWLAVEHTALWRFAPCCCYFSNRTATQHCHGNCFWEAAARGRLVWARTGKAVDHSPPCSMKIHHF